MTWEFFTTSGYPYLLGTPLVDAPVLTLIVKMKARPIIRVFLAVEDYEDSETTIYRTPKYRTPQTKEESGLHKWRGFSGRN